MTSWLKVTKIGGGKAIIPVDKINYIDYDEDGATRVHLPNATLYNYIRIEEELEEVIQILQFLAENGAN